MYDNEIYNADWDALNFKTYGAGNYEENFLGFDSSVYQIQE